MTPQQLVEECERLLKKHNMAGVVVAMDSEHGYYGLTLPDHSLFQWSNDDSKVKLSIADASQEQIEEEFHTLKTLDTMMEYCGRAIVALVTLLREATTPKGNPSNGGADKKYLN